VAAFPEGGAAAIGLIGAARRTGQRAARGARSPSRPAAS
jgi:hypothetical protein